MERKLQHVFNVLMSQGVLKFEHDIDKKGNAVNYRYTLTGVDPFYITNKEWYRMEEEFNLNSPPGDDPGDDMWPEVKNG